MYERKGEGNKMGRDDVRMDVKDEDNQVHQQY